MSPGDSHARIVQHILEQHCEETACLLTQRWSLLVAPDIGIKALARADERMCAHLDGLRVAGGFGRRMAGMKASAPGAAGPDLFAAAVLALEAGDLPAFAAFASIAPAYPGTQRVLLSALGWVSGSTLRGIGAALLDDPTPPRQELGLRACVLHRVDAGKRLDDALGSGDAALRSCALRCAGESGQPDRLAACKAALADADAGCRWWAARSAMLLGDRSAALDTFAGLASLPREIPPRGLDVPLKTMDLGAVRTLLGNLARHRCTLRLAVRGTGLCGDARYLHWLLKNSAVPVLARLAGEAFCHITGARLVEECLDRPPPADFTPGPTDNPDDDNVALDEDEGLPWPDPAKLQAWWEVNHQRFQPGVRYFMGAPPTVAHCRKVLREGYQRQRIAAAEYLCLLAPGTPLFPTSAPAWRQQRWLSQME